jgi:hypothetical protein
VPNPSPFFLSWFSTFTRDLAAGFTPKELKTSILANRSIYSHIHHSEMLSAFDSALAHYNSPHFPKDNS